MTLATMLACGSVYAQEDPTNRQYLFNLLNINPAYAGTRGVTTMTAGFRKQWAGVPGAPATGIFSLDAPLSTHHLGIGMQLYNSSVGMEKTVGLNGSFSTILNFSEEEFLSLGIQAGLMNYRIDRTSVALPFQNDPAFQNNTNVLLPTAGIGIYYQREQGWASFSAPSLLISTVKVDQILSVNSASLKNLQLLFAAGFNANFGDVVSLRPSIFMKWMSGKVFEVHANTSVWLGNIVGIGVSYRADDAVMGILELRISDRLQFGYSYGKNIGTSAAFNQPSHEAGIRFNFPPSE
ncbi:MAG: type IX secretion system membrane protein PorP/SprF [Chitinophagaceae bacterium]|nr:type IX secretion system membrane protein PorP/SprF [Chitinophagaceae bacterium]